LILRLPVLAALLLAAAPAMAAPGGTDSIKTRAEAAAFDGTILIGESDGTYRIVTVGADPVTPGAVWRWASITKQLAAVLTMQEVAKGTIDLDAPVSRYWPEWRAPEASRIRIRDLMLHDSGLPQPDESSPDTQGIPSFYRTAAASPRESANGYCAGPARAQPPAKFEYNNCDTIVMAEVLRRVTRKDFEALVAERLAKPLRLESLGIYRLSEDAAKHVRPTGEYASLDPLLNMGVYGASGGAYGTIADLWRFDHALMRGDLLSAEARETMWTSEKSNGFYGFFQWIFPARLVGCPGEVRVVERQGLIAGIELRNYLLPESGRAVIFFSRHRPADYGDPWEAKGFAFDILSQVQCK